MERPHFVPEQFREGSAETISDAAIEKGARQVGPRKDPKDVKRYESAVGQLFSAAAGDASTLKDLERIYPGWQSKEYERLLEKLGEDTSRIPELQAYYRKLDRQEAREKSREQERHARELRLALDAIGMQLKSGKDASLEIEEVADRIIAAPAFAETVTGYLSKGGELFEKDPAVADQLKNELLRATVNTAQEYRKEIRDRGDF